MIAAITAIITAVLTIWNGRRLARMNATLLHEEKVADRKIESERILSKFREPLLGASFDLQSRLYNIANQNLLTAYLIHGTAEEQAYVVNNTLFLIAQFFAWNEIIRRDIQFLDLGNQDHTRQLASLQDFLVHVWRTDEYGRELRIFAGDQRAIGGRLIYTSARGSDCIGYAEFLDIVASDPNKIPQLKRLTTDIHKIARAESARTDRILSVQHGLIDLLAFLDPDFIRYPRDHRGKL